LLQSYTLEELYYEYKEHSEREKAAKERVEQEADNIDKAKEDEALAWAEAEEKREAESLKSDPDIKPEWSPTPEDKAWMENQIKQGKELYGEDFGEDINEDF
jgi:hypothetical protein